MMVEPRSRKKIQRFGGHDNLDPRDVSDLDSSDSEFGGGKSRRSKRGRGRGDDDEDYRPPDAGRRAWSGGGRYRARLPAG